MSHDVVYCHEDQDISEAAAIMKEKQIRRLLVMNEADHLVGIVSLADLATVGANESRPADVLNKISEPG